MSNCREQTEYKHAHTDSDTLPPSPLLPLRLPFTYQPAHTHMHTDCTVHTYKWLLSFHCCPTKWPKLYLNTDRPIKIKLHIHPYSSLWIQQVFLYILIIGSCSAAYSGSSNPPITQAPFYWGNSGVTTRQSFRWQTFDWKHAIKSKKPGFFLISLKLGSGGWGWGVLYIQSMLFIQYPFKHKGDLWYSQVNGILTKELCFSEWRNPKVKLQWLWICH